MYRGFESCLFRLMTKNYAFTGVINLWKNKETELYKDLYVDFKKNLERNQILTFVFSTKFIKTNHRILKTQLEGSLTDDTLFRNWWLLKRKMRKIICRSVGRRTYERKFNRPIKKDYLLALNFTIWRGFVFGLQKLNSVFQTSDWSRIPRAKKRIKYRLRKNKWLIYSAIFELGQKKRDPVLCWNKKTATKLIFFKTRRFQHYIQHKLIKKAGPKIRMLKTFNKDLCGVAEPVIFHNFVNVEVKNTLWRTLSTLGEKLNLINTNYFICGDLSDKRIERRRIKRYAKKNKPSLLSIKLHRIPV